jgi:hypothetical protein
VGEGNVKAGGEEDITGSEEDITGGEEDILLQYRHL